METTMITERPRVLCVDDEPHVLRALTWLLGGQFDVCTATSAEEALGLLQQNDYDVVISDQRMSGLTGVEFLRDVRLRAPRAMRILLTGYSDLDAMEGSANESEVFRLVTKPWNVRELSSIVAEAAAIARSAPVEGRDSAQAVPRESILLVDDSADMGERVKEELRGTAEVIHATDLAQALSILERQEVAVIISEVKVRERDATPLLRVAKQVYPHIVSVVLSGTRDADQVMGLINEGQVFRFVKKPVQAGTIGPVIDAALRRHRQFRSTPELGRRYSVAPAPAAAEALSRSIAASSKPASGPAEDGSGPARKSGALAGLLRWLRGR